MELRYESGFGRGIGNRSRYSNSVERRGDCSRPADGVFGCDILIRAAPLVVKCVVGGLPLGFTLLVWIQFWSKAKTEPLSASEEYYIQELRYRYPGVDDSRQSAEQIESRPRVINTETSQTSQSDDEGESQQ